MRGWAINQWAHHLADAYKQIPQCQNLQLDTAALAAYDSINGVPQSWLQTMAAPATQQEADHILQQFAGDRQGYASTRTGSAEDPVAPTHLPCDESDTAPEPFPIGSIVWYRNDTDQHLKAQVKQVDAGTHCYQVQLIISQPQQLFWTIPDRLTLELGKSH